ncbi:hypothetical protein pb186bvf_010418 [Paramecium bursaria]
MDYYTFDFENNAKFQEYFLDLYPTPTDVEKYRKKWYKKNIDPNFENDNPIPQKEKQQAQPQEQQEVQPQKQQQEVPPQKQQQEQPQQKQQEQQKPQEQQQQQRPREALPLNYVIEGILKVLYFPSLIFILVPGYALYVNIGSLIIILMAIYRMCGKPQFNKEYLQKVLPNEFATNLYYIVAIISAPVSFAYQFPLALQYFVGAAEFWARLNGEPGYALDLANKIRQNRNTFILSKQKIEIGVFLYSIFGTFAGQNSFILTLILFQYIALKNKVNANMQGAQYQIKLCFIINMGWL